MSKTNPALQQGNMQPLKHSIYTGVCNNYKVHGKVTVTKLELKKIPLTFYFVMNHITF